MALIQLTKGQVALVDDADFEWLSQWKWHAHQKKSGEFYAARSDWNKGRIRLIYMHREILSLQKGNKLEGDHRDGSTLNNQRSNLRICTHAENLRNQRRRKLGVGCGVRGVYWDKARSKWKAQIKYDGKRYALGRFETKEEAAAAYNEAANRLFGDFSCPSTLNSPV